MKKLAQIYVKLMEKHGISKIPVLTAEDETAIKKVVSCDNKEDKLVGFCGMKTGNDGNHQCLKEISIVLGNDEHTHDLMIDSFNKYEIAGSAREVLLNPLHRPYHNLFFLLHQLVTGLLPKMLRHLISSQYKKWSEHIIGPLIGHSSDGDARRRKLMVDDLTGATGNRFRPIPLEKGFIYSTEKIEHDDGSYSLKGQGDQDAYHQLKKFINVLYLPSRVMTLGTNHLIHINHLQLVFDRFDRFQHDLSNIHLQRKDRQNVRIAQEVCFIQVILCLQKIIEGDDNHAPDESVTGTMCYLKVAWMYNGCHIIQKNYVCELYHSFSGDMEEFCSSDKRPEYENSFYHQRVL